MGETVITLTFSLLVLQVLNVTFTCFTISWKSLAFVSISCPGIGTSSVPQFLGSPWLLLLFLVLGLVLHLFHSFLEVPGFCFYFLSWDWYFICSTVSWKSLTFAYISCPRIGTSSVPQFLGSPWLLLLFLVLGSVLHLFHSFLEVPGFCLYFLSWDWYFICSTVS